MNKLYLLLTLTLSNSVFASYVVYTSPAPHQSFYQSNDASFKSDIYEFYSSGNSGSIEVYSGPAYEYYNFPNGIWVAASNGYVPRNAIVKEYINGRPLFYCRSLYNNTIFYGALVPDQGCYVQVEGNTVRLTNYDSLIPY